MMRVLFKRCTRGEDGSAGMKVHPIVQGGLKIGKSKVDTAKRRKGTDDTRMTRRLRSISKLRIAYSEMRGET